MENKTNERQKAKYVFWQKHIRTCRNSKLTQKEYCLKNGLAIQTFGYWKRKIRSKGSNSEKTRFFPLAVNPCESVNNSVNLSLILGEGRFQIEVGENFSEPTLKKLILTLEQL